MPDGGDLAACRGMMRGGSKSFFAAGLLLPKRVLAPATALYAFCRMADDAIDESAEKAAALDGLKLRLDRLYRGAPENHPADRAFADVVAAHDLPRALPDALLEGFAWDSQNRRYEDIYELHAYATRVAGTVGAMMAVLMGVRTAPALARACDLGIAMQLTNIARDVGEDARAGRLYLPMAWLREEGVDPDAFLARPGFSPALGRVVQRLVEAADALYDRSVPGITHLPMACRPAIRAAGLIYREIGWTLARRGYDSVSWRAHVPLSRKLVLLGLSFSALAPGDPDRAAGPAVAAAHALVHEAATVPWAPRRSFTERVLWVAELFARLEQQQETA